MSSQALDRISALLAFAIVLIGIGHSLAHHHRQDGEHRHRFHQETEWAARAEQAD